MGLHMLSIQSLSFFIRMFYSEYSDGEIETKIGYSSALSNGCLYIYSIDLIWFIHIY